MQLLLDVNLKIEGFLSGKYGPDIQLLKRGTCEHIVGDMSIAGKEGSSLRLAPAQFTLSASSRRDRVPAARAKLCNQVCDLGLDKGWETFRVVLLDKRCVVML